MKYDVSVVIPSYNSERFILDALKAICAQTFLPCEIIVVDDFSEDRTVEIASDFSKHSAVPVRVVSLQENSGGPARPLNIAVHLAVGRFIAINEHDDTMLPTRLELQAKCLEHALEVDSTVGFVTCFTCVTNFSDGPNETIVRTIPLDAISAKPLDVGGYIVDSKSAYEGLLFCRKYYMESFSNFMIPKAVWAAVGGFDERRKASADLEFCYRVFANHGFAIVAEPLTLRRRVPDHLGGNMLIAGPEYVSIMKEQLKLGRPDHVVSELRRRIQEELLDLADRLRRKGLFFPSAKRYVNYVASGGSIAVAIKGHMKILLTAVGILK